MADVVRTPPLYRGLSARLLALTVFLVLLGEIMIYVPSIARYRVVWLAERLDAAHLASLAMVAADHERVSPALERQLLERAGLQAIILHDGPQTIMLGKAVPVDAVIDLDNEGVVEMIENAFRTMLSGGDRTIRVFGRAPDDRTVLVDVILNESQLRQEMLAFSTRILELSLFLSALVALSLFVYLQRAIVQPLRRITDSVTAFSVAPERQDVVLPTTARSDELGVVQTELGRMQRRLRAALRQKQRLAALGSAVSKINHDLRNLLATAILVSDRLETSADPQVQRAIPRLVDALERASRLCGETLAFARSEEPPALRLERFALLPLVDEVIEAQAQPGTATRFQEAVPAELTVVADRDQLHRTLSNLIRNSVQALPADGGLVSVTAWRAGKETLIEVADTGQGIPEAVKPHLFEAFIGTSTRGGTGLGLANAREITERHGGTLALVRTGSDGSVFRLTLPDRLRTGRRSAFAERTVAGA